MKRYLIPALGLVVWLTGCEAPAAGGRIVVGESTDFGVLLPVIETSALDGEINSQLYLSLNSAGWEDGSVVYSIDDLSLAERWEYGPDSTTLTYFIRPGAVWSDGHPIDAEDVVFTFELVRKPEIASPYIDSWENLDSVVAASDRQVTFHFKRRYPGMLFHTGIGIIPAHVYAASAMDNATLASHPSLVEPGVDLVVSGPYQVLAWDRGDRLVLSANQRAFTTKPRADTIVIRVIPEETTRLVEFESGTLDVVGPIPMERAADLESDPRFRVETVDDRLFDFVAWNGARFDPFREPEVRRALSLAIDREAVLAGLGIAAYAEPAAGPYPQIFTLLADPGLKPDPYLPDSARAILASVGWVDRDGDGVVERDGRPFRFTLMTQAGNQRRSSAAEIIQARYAEVGIDMQIELVEFNSLLGIVYGLYGLTEEEVGVVEGV
ncbi:MAG: hypothetical protein JSU87_01045 [Gemmatimonadota bacterium]|nr:MAG: hypothetical protein JSU87_01045 [Gemmatimonadota bacterium]